MRLARGDADGALEDTEKSLARAREVKDAQNLCPTLAVRAFVLLSVGEDDAARKLAAETVERWAGVQKVVLPWGGVGAVAAIATIDGVAHLDALESQRSLWIAAALEFVAGNLEGAAETSARIGALADEAYARLKAAEQLMAIGDLSRAEAMREDALAFYRSVGADHYAREARAMGAART